MSGTSAHHRYALAAICAAAFHVCDAGAAQANVTRNSAGAPTVVTGPDGATSRFGYDASGRLTEILDPLGRRVQIGYDGRSERPAQIVGPGRNGPVRRFTYDAGGRPVRVEVDGEIVAQYSYDAQGRPTERRVRGRTIRFAYDGNGRLAAETDTLGRTWRYGYDAQGRLVQVTNPDGGIERATYDARGEIVSVEDATGVRRNAGALSRAASAPRTEARTQETYDAVNRLTGVRDASGSRVQWQYDDQSRVTAMTLPNGATLRWDYDKQGRPVKAADAAGHAVTYRYDAADRLSEVAEANERAAYRYDDGGRLTAVTRPNRTTLALAYDVADNLTQVQLPGGGARSAEYDRAHRVTATREAGGRRVEMKYDAQGRLAERKYAEGRSSRFGYDGAGRLVSIDDAVWPQQFVYDRNGHLNETRFGAVGANLAYETDAAGRRKTLRTPAGQIGYEYDAKGALVALATPAGRIAFAYAENGRLSAATLPNGVRGAWQFFADGALESLRWTARDGSVLADWKIERDPSGLPTAMTSAGVVRRFAYDASGRLSSESTPRVASRYEYAAGGDIVRIARPARTLQIRYDNAGRIADAEGAVAHDKDDRVVRMRRGDAEWNYAWDAEDRLVGARGPLDVRFAYDAFGRLVRRESGSDVRQFLYDDGDPVVVLGGDRKVAALNVFAPGCASPMLTIAGGEALFLPCDPFGATALAVDAKGQVVGRTEIDAFGFPVALPARPRDLFLLHGMPYDRDLGLYRAGRRWYDPRIARFLTPDPLIGNLWDVQAQNAYAYARNAPTAFADTTGAAVEDWSLNMRQAQRMGISESEMRAVLRHMTEDTVKHGFLTADEAARVSAERMSDVLASAQSLGVDPKDAFERMKASVDYKPPRVPTLAIPRADAAAAADRPRTLAIARPGVAEPPAPAPSGAASAGRASIGAIAAGAEGSGASTGARAATPSAAVPAVPAAPPAGASAQSGSGAPSGWNTIVRRAGDTAIWLSTLSIIQGITDALNCGARGGARSACADAFGQGFGSSLLGGIEWSVAVGTLGVVGGLVAKAAANVMFTTMGPAAGPLITAGSALAGAVGTFAGGAVATVGTAIVSGRLAQAATNFGLSKFFGTPQEHVASTAGLGDLDARIAELNDLSRAASDSLAKPLNDARQLRQALQGLRGGPDKPPVRSGPDDAAAAAQSLAEACAAATTALYNLSAQSDDARARAERAVKLLRDKASLDDTPNATTAAASAAKEALAKIVEAATTAKLAGTALADVGARSQANPAAAGAPGSADEWRQKIVAFNGAMDRLQEAVDAARSTRVRFNDLQKRTLAGAEALRNTVVRTDQPALQRRIDLVRGVSFRATPQIDEATDILRAGPAEMGASAKSLERKAGEADSASRQREKVCADFAAQPGGWRSAAEKARNGHVKALQSAVASVGDAARERNQRLAEVERKNNVILNDLGPKRLAEARADRDPKAESETQTIIDRAKARAKQSLSPQRASLDALLADHANTNNAVDGALSALASVR